MRFIAYDSIQTYSLIAHRLDIYSLRKTVGKMSPIPVTLTSRSDSNFESSNVSLKENKPDGVNPDANDIDYYVRKNEGKILWFSVDCLHSDRAWIRKNRSDRSHRIILAILRILLTNVVEP